MQPVCKVCGTQRNTATIRYGKQLNQGKVGRTYLKTKKIAPTYNSVLYYWPPLGNC